MKKPALLTVDDDQDVLRSISRDLRRRYGRDYRVLPAESAAAALQLLDQLEELDTPVALILSDQRMPGMDGVSFLAQAARQNSGAKRVLLTAYADTDAAMRAINQSHVHYYLLKPWDPPEDKLFPVLDDMLEEWRSTYRPGYGGVRVVGDRWSARCHTIRDFLARNQVPYSFLDVEVSEEGRALVGELEASEMPLVLLPDGERLLGPDPQTLAAHIGLEATAKEAFYDLAIVGGGPGGLAAAVYGGSEGLRTVLIEQEAPGGQAGTSSRIENYLGFPAGLSGGDLARRAVTQARKFGVEILTPQAATALRVEGPYKHLTLADGSEISCHVLMLAVGVSWKLLPAEGADRFVGAGVYYGAAMTEALHAAGRTVFMVGAGNSAGQAAMYFKDHAERVVMLVRGDSLSAKMSKYLVDRIERCENIDVRLETEVVRCTGSSRLEGLELRSRKNGACETVPAEYLFAFLGAAPRTGWLEGILARDERGFVLTGRDLDPERHLQAWPLEREPLMLETNVPGIFACGDVRHDSVKRVASAVGEGSVSVAFMHRILAER
ncbi:MAG: FAD-dependent oxidoreductase [Longimicrobiales bacterium]|nr:FAD-dependent oxidoreductase [Longimicrobiales bacterium]